MERLNDYNNYDKLVLFVKNNKTQYIISKYKSLGWELVTSICNHKYRNIMDLTFVRPHKYKDKDKLQLLQVKMEMCINRIAKLEKNKHTFSKILGINFTTIGIIFLIFSVLNFFNTNQPYNNIVASIFGIIGTLLFILMYILLPKIYLRENIKFDNKYKILELELNKIMSNITSINT